MIISLVGYMGGGKSHISNILSEKLNFKILDTDKEISQRNRLSIAEIFQKKGELAFRKMERELLEEVLATGENLILSLGGGTPAYYNNMEVINERSISIYLQAGVGTLVERLSKQKSKRPLIAHLTDEQLPEFVAKHLFERNVFYNRSRYKISTDHKTPEEVAEGIIDLIKDL